MRNTEAFLSYNFCSSLAKDIGLLFKNAFLDDFIDGRRGKAEARFEARLNTGKLVDTHFDDFIDCLLTCTNDPDLTLALASYFSVNDWRLRHIGIGAYILSRFVDHEQKTIVMGFSIRIP